jgi:hypothetical protein
MKAGNAPVREREVAWEKSDALEAMCPRQQARWLELLSYLWALLYHERSAAEHPPLQKKIEASLAAQLPQREVNKMVKTYADVLREEGEKRGEIRALRHMLLKLLEKKFGEVPEATPTSIKATTSPKQLEQWMMQVDSASTLEEMQIESPS